MAKYILILLFFLSSAHASELRLGLGQNYGVLHGDGVWIQENLDNHIDNGKPTVAFQYIGQVSQWLDYGLGLAYRDGPTASGVYVSDECYASRTFSGGAFSDSAGMPACDRRYHAKKIHASTYAFTATLNPTWRADNFSLSLGLGVSFFNSKLTMEWDRDQGVCANPTLCQDNTFRGKGKSFYTELTAKYSRFFITAYSAKEETAPESMAKGNRGFFTGVSFHL